jgi:hypothetical protein
MRSSREDSIIEGVEALGRPAALELEVVFAAGFGSAAEASQHDETCPSAATWTGVRTVLGCLSLDDVLAPEPIVGGGWWRG